MVSILVLVGVVILIILVIAALIIVGIFNGLVQKRNRVQDAWAQIDVQLKRRYDLIPNLISTVQGYMKYEKSVLTQVTALRASIVNGSVQDKATANNQLSQALKSIFAVAENYPNLKADESFQNLQQELENTEDKISFVRTSYNDYVLDYNNAIQQFPGIVFATPMGFQKSDFFQAPDEAKEPVKVDFSNIDSGTGDDGAPNAPAAPAAPAKAPKHKKTPPAAPPSSS